MFNARWCAGVLVVILALPAAAAAQVTTADIVGRVTDSSGAVLPGATVTIENLATHDVRTAPTNETGDYLFNLLPIGTYTVNVELQGFASQTTRVVLSAGDRVRFDPKLQLGQVQGQQQITSMDSRISPRMLLTMARQGSITLMELLSRPFNVCCG